MLIKFKCIYEAEVHVAPYGESGSRCLSAERKLAQAYGYSLKGRTMFDHVLQLMRDRDVQKNKHDAQTGVVIHRSDDEVDFVCMRQLFWVELN